MLVKSCVLVECNIRRSAPIINRFKAINPLDSLYTRFGRTNSFFIFLDQFDSIGAGLKRKCPRFFCFVTNNHQSERWNEIRHFSFYSGRGIVNSLTQKNTFRHLTPTYRQRIVLPICDYYRPEHRLEVAIGSSSLHL